MTSADDPEKNALQILLERMQAESDFPALSEAISAINRIAESDHDGVNELSNHILKDFALTSKLLKLVNAAYYTPLGGGTISTVSRAVVILGFNAVRAIALSLILFDNMENQAHAQLLKEEFVRILYAGMLARELARHTPLREVEEAFIGAMLHTLGRTLTMCYFPDKMGAITTLIEADALAEEPASTRILGVSFERLGSGIAAHWGFPDSLLASMKRLPRDKLKKNAMHTDPLRVLAGYSNELCDIILGTPDAEREHALGELTTRYGDCVALTVTQLYNVMEKSMQDIAEFALAVNVNLQHNAFAREASRWVGVAAPVEAAADASADGLASALEAATLHAPHTDALPTDTNTPRSSEQIQALLASGLQDVGNSLIDDSISVNDILRMILEAMYTGMGFEHVVLCIKDGRHNTMRGKFGFGDEVQTLVRAFDFSLAAPSDVFLVALNNNADILIADIDDAKITARIPAWYRQSIHARTFVLFPIIVKAKPIGLIYADRAAPGAIAIPEKELSLLKSLRNQAVLAIRQSI